MGLRSLDAKGPQDQPDSSADDAGRAATPLRAAAGTAEVARPARSGHSFGPLVPALFGMAFTLLFNLALFACVPEGRTAGLLGVDLSRIIACFAFVGLAIASRRGTSLMANRPALVLVAAISAAGVLICLLATSLSAPLATPMLMAGLCLAEGGYCVLFLAWMETLAHLSMDYALLYYIVARMVAALVRTSLGVMPAPAVCAIAIAAPLLSVTLLMVGLRALPSLPYAQGEKAHPRWSFPWRPVVLLATFSLASQFVMDATVNVSNRGSMVVGSVLACLFVLAIVVVRFRRFDLKASLHAALPLLLAGMMCQMLGGGFSGYAVTLSFGASDLFLAFVYALMFDLCYRRGVNALWVFGITQAAVTLGIVASHVLRNVLGEFATEVFSAEFVMAVLAVVTTVVFMGFLTDKDYANAWGMRSEGTNGAAGEPESSEATLAAEHASKTAALEAACAVASRQYGLTRREEEVLLLRLSGASHRELEDSLVISNNTVKSHVRHIYQKLGVRDLDEARAVVGGLGEK